MGDIVASTGVKYDKFKTMQLSQTVISKVTDMNATRSSKKHPFTWDHIKDGYTGGFYKYIEGVSPVMKSEQVNDYLALVYCPTLNND